MEGAKAGQVWRSTGWVRGTHGQSRAGSWGQVPGVASEHRGRPCQCLSWLPLTWCLPGSCSRARIQQQHPLGRGRHGALADPEVQTLTQSLQGPLASQVSGS